MKLTQTLLICTTLLGSAALSGADDRKPFGNGTLPEFLKPYDLDEDGKLSVEERQAYAKAMREVILPTIRGMEKDGIPFTGFLYAGLMISPDGQLKVLEFNCRMGDPETQPILMRLKSDLVDALLAATDSQPATLSAVELTWDRRFALGVVLAAANYPATPRRGDAIQGLPPDQPDVMVFHAATQAKGDLQAHAVAVEAQK